MKTIDLSKYVTARHTRWDGAQMVLAGYQNGQRVAKDENMKQYAGDELLLEVPFSFTKADVKFLSGMLRPLIRKQGVDETVIKVTTTNDNLRNSLNEFFIHEKVRLSEMEEKKKKEAGGGLWSSPQGFFIPDIGTIVRLQQDWTFRLHAESRNYDMFQLIGVEYNSKYNDSSHWWRSRYGNLEPNDVILKAGTKLKIDRVYIRKGAKEYSSITFNVVKGKDSVAQVAKGEHVFKTKGARFWAKLSDVNQMVVEIDLSTLAEN